MCGKIGRNGKEAIFYIRWKRTMANFLRVWNSALWKNWISANTTLADITRFFPNKGNISCNIFNSISLDSNDISPVICGRSKLTPKI